MAFRHFGLAGLCLLLCVTAQHSQDIHLQKSACSIKNTEPSAFVQTRTAGRKSNIMENDEHELRKNLVEKIQKEEQATEKPEHAKEMKEESAMLVQKVMRLDDIVNISMPKAPKPVSLGGSCWGGCRKGGYCSACDDEGGKLEVACCRPGWRDAKECERAEFTEGPRGHRCVSLRPAPTPVPTPKPGTISVGGGCWWECHKGGYCSKCNDEGGKLEVACCRPGWRDAKECERADFTEGPRGHRCVSLRPAPAKLMQNDEGLDADLVSETEESDEKPRRKERNCPQSLCLDGSKRLEDCSCPGDRKGKAKEQK